MVDMDHPLAEDGIHTDKKKQKIVHAVSHPRGPGLECMRYS